MRFSFVSGVRNDLLQLIANYTEGHGLEANITTGSWNYSNSVAGGTTGNVISYTVPANRRARISNIGLMQTVQTAATVVNGSNASVLIHCGSTGTVSLVSPQMYRNTVGDESSIVYPDAFWLNAGDYAYGYVYNLNTGGNIYFRLCALVQEFDV